MFPGNMFQKLYVVARVVFIFEIFFNKRRRGQKITFLPKLKVN